VGFYDYGARSYDPALGRFLQADTIVPNPANPQSLNRYAYVYNRPLNYVDSGGHNPIPIVLVVVVASKVIDYGWTLYDMGQSAMVLADVDASRDDRMMAGLNIALAVSCEALEPDEASVGLPTDDIGRHGVLKYGDEAVDYGKKIAQDGLEALGKFKPYNELRQAIRGQGLQAHHIVESRFKNILGIVDTGKIPSVALTPSEHQTITNFWRSLIGYKGSRNPITTLNATRDDVWHAAQQVYADHPELLQVAEQIIFGQLGK
jgi:hypothetical protein